MGKRIYNFDEFVNESYTNEGFFSDLGAKVSSWAKNLYNAVKSGIISLISSGPKAGTPRAALFDDSKSESILDQVNNFYKGTEYYKMNNLQIPETIQESYLWEDFMVTTSTQTQNAFIKVFNEYIKSATPCTSGETCNDVYDEKIYTDFWQGCYIDYLTQYKRFWNMMICEPLTGIQTESVTVPLLTGGSISVNYNVDYGDGTFDLTIAEEYQTMTAQFMCCIQNVMVLIMGETFEQSTFTEFVQVTYP